MGKKYIIIDPDKFRKDPDLGLLDLLGYGLDGIAGSIILVFAAIVAVMGLIAAALYCFLFVLQLLGIHKPVVSLPYCDYLGYQPVSEQREYDFYAIKDDRKHTIVSAEIGDDMQGEISMKRGKYGFVIDTGTTATFLPIINIGVGGINEYGVAVYDPLWTRIRVIDANGESVIPDTLETVFTGSSLQEQGKVIQLQDSLYMSKFESYDQNADSVYIRAVKDGYKDFEITLSVEEVNAGTVIVSMEKQS